MTRCGISQIIVTCPSCFDLFTSHAPAMKVTTAYEIMADAGIRPTIKPAIDIRSEDVCIHDACQTRFKSQVHRAIRKITSDCGLKINELPDNRGKTFCCGEGAGVRLAYPDMARSWTSKRLKDINRRKAVCYCAGCAGILSHGTDTIHALDLFFDPEQALAGKCKNYRPPVTYFNRLVLKYRLAEMLTKDI